jgi:hypothetical protein
MTAGSSRLLETAAPPRAPLPQARRGAVCRCRARRAAAAGAERPLMCPASKSGPSLRGKEGVAGRRGPSRRGGDRALQASARALLSSPAHLFRGLFQRSTRKVAVGGSISMSSSSSSGGCRPAAPAPLSTRHIKSSDWCPVLSSGAAAACPIPPAFSTLPLTTAWTTLYPTTTCTPRQHQHAPSSKFAPPPSAPSLAFPMSHPRCSKG